MNTSTEVFSVTLTDVPERYSKVILSFAVLDPEEAMDNMRGGGVFVLDVVNEGCNEVPLRISLDWDDEDENISENPNFSPYRYTFMYLFVNEPSGNRISRLWPVSVRGRAVCTDQSISNHSHKSFQNTYTYGNNPVAATKYHISTYFGFSILDDLCDRYRDSDKHYSHQSLSFVPGYRLPQPRSSGVRRLQRSFWRQHARRF